jgi:hypothetical protein
VPGSKRAHAPVRAIARLERMHISAGRELPDCPAGCPKTGSTTADGRRSTKLKEAAKPRRPGIPSTHLHHWQSFSCTTRLANAGTRSRTHSAEKGSGPKLRAFKVTSKCSLAPAGGCPSFGSYCRMGSRRNTPSGRTPTPDIADRMKSCNHPRARATLFL